MHPVYTSISLYLHSISFHYILCTSSLFLPCRIPNDRPESICIYVCFRWHLRNRCLFLCFTYQFSPVAVFALYSFLCSSLRTFYLSWGSYPIDSFRQWIYFLCCTSSLMVVVYIDSCTMPSWSLVPNPLQSIGEWFLTMGLTLQFGTKGSYFWSIQWCRCTMATFSMQS